MGKTELAGLIWNNCQNGASISDIIDLLERDGKSDSTSEKDLRVCEVIASAWVSVEERLPELNQRFHAFVNSKIEYNCGAYVGHWNESDMRKAMLIKGITHWMPVQIPPE